MPYNLGKFEEINELFSTVIKANDIEIYLDDVAFIRSLEYPNLFNISSVNSLKIYLNICWFFEFEEHQKDQFNALVFNGEANVPNRDELIITIEKSDIKKPKMCCLSSFEFIPVFIEVCSFYIF